MKLTLVVVLALAATATASTLDTIIAREGPASGSFAAFQGFMAEFDRVYNSPSEMARRFAIFQENMEKAAMQNLEEPMAEYGVTRFSDMTYEEFAAGFLTVFPDESDEEFDTSVLVTPAPRTALAAPSKSKDWREKLNKIKDQKSCGSCWAFSAMAAVEGALVTGPTEKLVDGSEQHLVDCDKQSGGCRGGWMHSGIALAVKDGIKDQNDYPYQAKNGKCVADEKETIATISGMTVRCANYPYVPDDIRTDYDCTDDETRAAVEVRPQSIAINANAMMSYRGGVADPKSCSPDGLNHGVDIVGFDEEDGVQYYIIRNSWGTRWGEQGHYRLIANKNACGINRYQLEALA